MAEQLVPTVRTPMTLAEYARAVVLAWSEVEASPVTKAAVAVLYAQMMIETGGRYLWNWNVGNVKHVAGDGFDYVALTGVWEGVSPAEASRLIAAGLAISDPSAEHAKAVGAGKVSVTLTPQNPGVWFRAYDSLGHAMVEHLRFLARKRYASAWPFVLAGDVLGFANQLKARGYFTASAEAYAAGMRGPFAACMASTAFDDALAEIAADRPTADQLEEEPAIIHPPVDFADRRYDED